jgi:hypothetical protein
MPQTMAPLHVRVDKLTEVAGILSQVRRAADGYADWLQTKSFTLSPTQLAEIRAAFGDKLLFARGAEENLRLKRKKR